jgi:hypothetical protein
MIDPDKLLPLEALFNNRYFVLQSAAGNSIAEC